MTSSNHRCCDEAVGRTEDSSFKQSCACRRRQRDPCKQRVLTREFSSSGGQPSDHAGNPPPFFASDFPSRFPCVAAADGKRADLRRAAVSENNAAGEGQRRAFQCRKIATIWIPSERPSCRSPSLRPRAPRRGSSPIWPPFELSKAEDGEFGIFRYGAGRGSPTATCEWRNSEEHLYIYIWQMPAVRTQRRGRRRDSDTPAPMPYSLCWNLHSLFAIHYSLCHRGPHVSQAQAAAEAKYLRL
jgi:hypothetical protein